MLRFAQPLRWTSGCLLFVAAYVVGCANHDNDTLMSSHPELKPIARSVVDKQAQYAERTRCLAVDITRHIVAQMLDPETSSWRTFADTTTKIGLDQDLGQLRRLMTSTVKDATGEYVANERYTFAVRREKASDPFQLDAGIAATDLHARFRHCDIPLNAPIAVRSMPIESMFRGNGFELNSVTPRAVTADRQATKPPLRFDFIYKGKPGDATKPPAKVGDQYWFELDPSTSLLVRGGFSRKYDAGTFRSSVAVDYGATYNDGPFPSRIEILDENEERGRIIENSREVFELGKPRPCSENSDKYYLAHYGFSEASVDFLNQRRTSLIVLFFLGLGGLIAALVGLRFFVLFRRDS